MCTIFLCWWRVNAWNAYLASSDKLIYNQRKTTKFWVRWTDVWTGHLLWFGVHQIWNKSCENRDIISDAFGCFAMIQLNINPVHGYNAAAKFVLLYLFILFMKVDNTILHTCSTPSNQYLRDWRGAVRRKPFFYFCPPIQTKKPRWSDITYRYISSLHQN